MESTLAVPLSMAQIDAANRLHHQLRQWLTAEAALGVLRARFPEFSMEATLIKVVAINQLYGTQVWGVTRLAERITEFLDGREAQDIDDLVEQLAQITDRKLHSFASKFAHFFVDAERYPIYDEYAATMVGFHLGIRGKVTNTARRYEAFRQNLELLKWHAGISCSNAIFDHYLWLAGLYHKWRNNHDAKINLEVRAIFEHPTAEQVELLTHLG